MRLAMMRPPRCPDLPSLDLDRIGDSAAAHREVGCQRVQLQKIVNAVMSAGSVEGGGAMRAEEALAQKG